MVGKFAKPIVGRLRRVVTGWRLLLVIVSFFAALHYDQYRNRPAPPRHKFEIPNLPHSAFLRIRNPLDLKNPDTTKLGEIENQPSATQLYEDFRHDEQKARREYLGKTYLIEGAVVEMFDLNTSNIGDELSMSRPPRFDESVTVGMMLLPETPEMLHAAGVETIANLHPSSISTHFDPYAYEKLYHDLLKARDPSFHPEEPYRNVYGSYSDDVSFRSHVGGVYCMFASPHSTTPYLRDEPRRRRITAECKIVDYKAGGIEHIEAYKLADKEATKRQTKPRVLAAGCVEINYEVDK